MKFHQYLNRKSKAAMTTSTKPLDSIELPDGRRITGLRLFIHQPQLHPGPIEWNCSIADLMAFADTAKQKAQTVEGAAKMHGVLPFDEWAKVYLNPDPNDKDCAFCRAMATCPSVRTKLEQSVGADFGVIAEEGIAAVPPPESVESDRLSQAMKVTDLLEDWAKSVRAEVERRLLAGESVDGFGLELGRMGARKFNDQEAAINLFKKTFRLKDELVFKFELKTPTQLEKLYKLSKREITEGAKPVLTPRQWEKAKALIVQADPKPSVKPLASIKEPYIPSGTDTTEFVSIPEESEDSMY